MENSIDIVNELHSTLKSLLPLKSEDKNRLDKKFRLEFNYNSNHLEGNTLTYGETELLLFYGDTMGKHNMREYEETQAHDVAYHIVEEWAKDFERPLTEQNIKNLNEIILVRPYWKEAITPDGQNTRRQIKVGDYKEYPNSVRLQNGEIFDYASPVDTPILMQELIDWYRSEELSLHPVTLAAMLHYKFVCIHPFDDGNGRISRLLMNYVLLKHGYPPVIIKSADKANYLRTLHIADIGDYEPFISYISEQLAWSLELSIKAAKGESLEDGDDFIKEIELLKRKASFKGTPKSPKVIYNMFLLVNKKLWRSINDTLKYFDTLFNETKETHNVNNWDEVFETKYTSAFDIVANTFKKNGISSESKKTEIFGHDIYENDVRTIGWMHKMFALRGADSPVDLEIYLEIEYSHYNYNLRLQSNLVSIYKLEKSYDDLFLSTEIDDMNNALKKHLVEFIKNKIN